MRCVLLSDILFCVSPHPHFLPISNPSSQGAELCCRQQSESKHSCSTGRSPGRRCTLDGGSSLVSVSFLLQCPSSVLGLVLVLPPLTHPTLFLSRFCNSLLDMKYNDAVDFLASSKKPFLLTVARATEAPPGSLPQQLIGIRIDASQYGPKFGLELRPHDGDVAAFVKSVEIPEAEPEADASSASPQHLSDFAKEHTKLETLMVGDQLLFVNHLLLNQSTDMNEVQTLIENTSSAVMVLIRTLSNTTMLVAPRRRARAYQTLQKSADSNRSKLLHARSIEDLLQQRGSQQSLFNSALYTRDLPPAPFLQQASWSAPYVSASPQPPASYQSAQQLSTSIAQAQAQTQSHEQLPLGAQYQNAFDTTAPFMSSTPLASVAGSPPRNTERQSIVPAEAMHYRAG